MDFVKIIATELKIRPRQVENTVELLDDENTIPFIARYRKEVPVSWMRNNYGISMTG